MRSFALLRSVRGASMVEYIVVVGIVALAGTVAFDGFYTQAKDLIGREASAATAKSGGAP